MSECVSDTFGRSGYSLYNWQDRSFHLPRINLASKHMQNFDFLLVVQTMLALLLLLISIAVVLLLHSISSK